MFGHLFGTRGRIGRLEFLLLVPYSIAAALIGASIGLVQFRSLPDAISDLGWEALLPTLLCPIEHLEGAGLILILFLIWCALARGFAVKRLHDRGRSGGWLWLVVAAAAISLAAPFVDTPLWRYGALTVAAAAFAWLMVEMFFLPGTPGENRFGAPPPPIRLPI